MNIKEHINTLVDEKKEQRTMKQLDVDLNDNGKTDCMIIPNYREVDEFMSDNEIVFYRKLKDAVYLINNENELKLAIFCQVALNRIITVNNSRIKDEIKQLLKQSLSIDFVLYDEIKDKVFCCIELDGYEHDRYDRKLRDEAVEEAFKLLNIKLLRYRNKCSITSNELTKDILTEKEIKL